VHVEPLVVLGDRRVAQRSARRDHVGRQRRGVDQRLEGRARLPAGLAGAIEARLIPAQPADQRLDVLGLVVPHERADLRRRLALGGQRRGVLAPALLRLAGQDRLGGGLDDEAAARVLLRQRPRHLAARALGVPGRQAAVALDRRPQLDRLLSRSLIIRLGQKSSHSHPAQHVVAPRARLRRLHERAGAPRRLGQTGQERNLGRAQLGERSIEVGTRRGGHPVRAGAEEDLVGVHLEDAPLGVAPLEAARHQRLAHLAPHALLAPDLARQERARHLLRDGRRALQHAAGPVVGPRGARHRLGVDAMMLEEARVLGGQQRRHRQLRQVVER
jgi:hypothetical protein